MAWFGEGLSSLKGQISNLTKEVATNVVGISLNEDSRHPTEDEGDCAVPSYNLQESHVEKLQAHCKSQDEEISQLREDNERLRRLLARQTPRDRRVSEEATLECEVAAPNASTALPLVSLEELGTDSFLGQDQVPKDAKAEEEISSLRSRLRKTFQEKVLMEQSCSRLEKEVALLTRQVTEDRQQAQAGRQGAANRSSSNNHQSCQTESSSCQSSGSQALDSLAHENEQLNQERLQLRGELARLTRVVQELESQIAFSQDENSNLSTGMEELDLQHQQAIEEIVLQKDSTLKRYEILLAEYDELKDKYKELVESSKKPTKKETRNVTHSESQTDCGELCADKTQMPANISEEIKSMITTEIPEKYFETGKENANGLETVAAVEKMLSHTLSRAEASEGKIRDLLSELRTREEEVQEIEDENKTLRIKIEELKEQNDTLPIIAENNEDIEVMENRIIALENEVSILREVRSNLEVQHVNSRSEIESLIRRLQSSEAMIRNQDNLQTEIAKYKEDEKDLLLKLENSENSREQLLLDASKMNKTLKNNKITISELEERNAKLETLLNEKTKQETENGLEKLYEEALDELQQEKTLRGQTDAMKDDLVAEIKKLKHVEKEYETVNGQLKQSKITISTLQEEIAELNKRISNLEENNKHEQANLLEKIKSEENLVKCSENALEDLRKKLNDFELKESVHKNAVVQLNFENEMKLKELKSINTSLTQKCVKLEKEMRDLSDLSEESDSLKIEMDLKHRKMCEMILEKSIADKELEAIKVERDNLEKKLNEELLSTSDRDKTLLEELKNILGTTHNNSQQKNVTIPDLIKEIASKLESLEQERSQLHLNNASLTENVTKLLSEVNEKSDCLLKMSAHLETLRAEKHSLEDRLRNLKETVSTGNQTDQSDSPEITREKYAKIKTKLEDREAQFQELESNYKKLLATSEQSLNQVNEQLRLLHNERQQLIETVQTKHAESVKYHAEIQRLCAELSRIEQDKVTSTLLLQKQIEDKEGQLASLQTSSDRQVAALNEQLHTLQNQLDYVSQLLRVTDRQEAEGQPASDSTSVKNQSSNTEFVEKEATRVDELCESLQQEQLRNKYLQDEVSEQHEKEAALSREVERLREHLVAVEENYTAELVRAEQTTAELTQRLAAAEDRAKTSTTAYTSASIRANQQVESLGGQMRQLLEQKEKLTAQLALAEDKLHKQAAALTNLQAVLEHFQRDKERNVAMENERIKQNLEKANNKNADLLNDIKALQLQLKEAKEGLSAASRLTEQLDQKSRVITELKQEVTELTEKLKKADERIHAASVSVEGKVDRCLVRNLVVGYVSAPPSSQAQALGIIATVLDFTPDDRLRSGLDPGAKGSLKQQSLSEAFVRFLENESQPQPHLRLTLQQGTQDSRSRKSSVTEVGLTPARRISGSVLKDVLKQDL